MNTVVHNTGSNGITVQSHETTFSSRGELLPAFLAKPAHAAPGSLPIILVVRDYNDDELRAVCCRLAEAGYLAIASDLSFRARETAETQGSSSPSDNEILADLDHAANQAVGHGGDLRRLGLTGFGGGGRIAWLYAAHNPQLQAAVAWYGPLLPEITLKQPLTPVDVTDRLTAPVLGLYGAKDTQISLEDISLMRQALRAANNSSEIITYPDAGQEFPVSHGSHYNESAASDGWQRMLDWFARHQLSALPVGTTGTE